MHISFDLELRIKNGSDPVVVPFSFVKRIMATEQSSGGKDKIR